MAIGRSNPVPSFLRFAGARLMVIFFGGMSKSAFFKATCTRSLASRTSLPREPTMEKPGNPVEISTSTWTRLASMPKRAPPI